MEYINEYGIFNFWKKPKEVTKKQRIKDIFVSLKKSYFIRNNSDPSKVLFVKSNENKQSDLIANSDNLFEYLTVKNFDDDPFLSFWSYIPGKYSSSISEYVCYDLFVKSIDDNLTSFGICKGLPVYIKDLNTNGTIIDLCYAIFAEYESSMEMRDNGKISKVLIIEAQGKKYFRLPSQVTILKEVPNINLAPEFREIIEDYLLDATESGKFTVKISPSIENTVAIFNVSIVFSAGIDLQSVAYFFSTINTLKKRLHQIDDCDISIENLSKSGIEIKIFKNPVTEKITYIKEYDEFGHSCDMCGEIIYDDSDLCNNCMSKPEIEIEQPEEKKVVLCDGVPAYPRSQQIYNESNNKTFRSIEYDQVEEWAETRIPSKLYNSDIKYIKNIFQNKVTLDIESVDSIMSLTILENENEGMAIVIRKYDDDYYWITFYESVIKNDDKWEQTAMSDSYEYICDQLDGVGDAMRHFIQWLK